jgi:rare lipoprotein A
MTHTTGRATRAAAVRASLAAITLMALGGSIQAVYAQDSVTVPTQTPVAADNFDLPRFQPSEAGPFEAAFDGMGNPAGVTVPAHAVDLEEIEPAVDEAIAEDIPDGVASWYGAELAGNKTASGERFNPQALTAAHRTLPLGSKVRVTHGGKSVVVRINDRGPFHGNRVIDLSQAAAEQIGLRRKGSGRVELVRLVS